MKECWNECGKCIGEADAGSGGVESNGETCSGKWKERRNINIDFEGGRWRVVCYQNAIISRNR